MVEICAAFAAATAAVVVVVVVVIVVLVVVVVVGVTGSCRCLNNCSGNFPNTSFFAF